MPNIARAWGRSRWNDNDGTLVDEDVRKSLLALGGASAVLWLIACVNVRIVQQLLIEGLMLSSVASLLGIALAMLTLRMFEHGLKTQFHIYTTLTPNLRVLSVLLTLTVMSALVSSALPALAAVRAAIEPALRQGATQSGTGRRQHRLRAGLVWRRLRCR
jgi:hypothetical protein